jgi:hypothetical protein
MTPGGAVSVVHRFKGNDGLLPLSSLTATSNLHVYGTTLLGGSGSSGFIPGVGTAFHLIAQPAPSDYDGDAVSDLALFNPATGTWKIRPSSTLAPTTVSWGLRTDKPAPGDYDGDGMMDPTIFRPSTGMWHILKSSTSYSSSQSVSLGIRTDVPVPGDYDGDGITDPAVFRPSTGAWLIRNPVNFSTMMTPGGTRHRPPVPGDYDGDGQNDAVSFLSGTWTS